MLVLSRKTNETIELPELGISIEVIKVKGGTVRLGIKAPASIRILRGELLETVTDFEDLPPVLNVVDQATQDHQGSAAYPAGCSWTRQSSGSGPPRLPRFGKRSYVVAHLTLCLRHRLLLGFPLVVMIPQEPLATKSIKPFGDIVHRALKLAIRLEL